MRLFILRDACSDAIAELFRACVYCTIIVRYVAQWGIAQMCLYETAYQGQASHHFGGYYHLFEEVSRNIGYRSGSIAISRDIGPLRSWLHSVGKCHLHTSLARLF